MLSFLLCPNRWDSQSNLAMGELLLPVVLLSRSVWFGSVSRVKFLCPFSPSPHCTMLSHPPQFDSLTRFCQQTMQMHFSPSAVCVRARRRELGSGSRCTRPVPEGTGEALSAGPPRNPAAPQGTPYLLLSALTISRTQSEPKTSQPILSCLFSATARTFDWSHPPPQWVFSMSIFSMFSGISLLGPP